MLFVFLSWWCKHLNSFSGDFIRVSSPCSIPKITCWYNWLIQLAISPYQESPEKKSSMGFPNDIFTMRNIKTLLKQTHSYPNSSWVYWVYTSNGILSWVTMKSPWSHHWVSPSQGSFSIRPWWCTISMIITMKFYNLQPFNIYHINNHNIL